MSDMSPGTTVSPCPVSNVVSCQDVFRSSQLSDLTWVPGPALTVDARPWAAFLGCPGSASAAGVPLPREASCVSLPAEVSLCYSRL